MKKPKLLSKYERAQKLRRYEYALYGATFMLWIMGLKLELLILAIWFIGQSLVEWAFKELDNG